MFSEQVIAYYKQIKTPAKLPREVGVMNPFLNPDTLETAGQFYRKFYSDNNERYICFGINPGRFGAGITGVPFTDPIRLQEDCNIENSYEKKAELSSKFIYEMIAAFGGVDDFYSRFYISAVSPLGYLKDGINLNYYDIKGFKEMFETYAVKQIKLQIPFGINTEIAFSIGKGQNIKYLNYLNDKYNLFGKIIPLSHPRWVMQYRLKRKEEFINEYLQAFQLTIA